MKIICKKTKDKFRHF